MASPAPKSPEQNEKSKKYDRQLRLWGDHGQKCLENSKVCLINATALGTEILKSLVLPGIAAFTIVDGEKVTEEDIGSNFFLERDALGKSRAQAATMDILELNPDVRGNFIDEFLEHLMAHTQNFFESFTVVIATALPEKVLLQLSKQLWTADIPLIVCRSVGFFGYIRLQVHEHVVIETHPDNETPDLRLDQPWPALQEYLDKVDISKLDTKERSHVPALTILYYFLQKFKSAHEGILPESRAHKEELRKMIRDSIPMDEGSFQHLEENFVEAIHLVNMCVGPTRIPPRVEAILIDDKCLNLTQESTPFWVLCAALREFVQNEGALPVRGSLPDMAADTASYVALQELYRKQAQAQTEIIYRRAVQIARSLGQASDSVSESETRLFCKHANELFIMRGTCIADEYQSNSPNVVPYLEDPDGIISHYVILRGLERFINECNTYPGQFDEQVEPDVLKLKSITGRLLAEWGSTLFLKDEQVHEMCRYGGAELHSVSAMLAGCAAHEVIKLITHQYKPLNNTFIYDAITSNSTTFTL